MFFITVSNGLLKGGHRKRMGAAVWEFMWCLDKITRINEQGEGFVLGGKPVNLKDLADDLEVSEVTVSRNLELLEQYGYIRKIRTPYGLGIRVAKAKKRFNKSDKRDLTEVITPVNKSDKSNIRYNSDITVRQDAPEGAGDKVDQKLLADAIFEFRLVNPSYKRLFSMPPQRAAMTRLAEQHGFEKLFKVIKSLPSSNSSTYAPTITTPVQLENEFGKLLAFYAKQKNKTTSKGRGLEE